MSDNRRITEQVLAYWNDLKGDKAFPSFNDITPEGMEDLWPDCFVLKVFFPHSMARRPNDYEFIYLGENVIPLFGEEINNPKALPFPEKVIATYQDVVDTRSAITDDGEFENMRNERVKYRQILLPLGPEDEMIDHILGGIRHKGGGELGPEELDG